MTQQLQVLAAIEAGATTVYDVSGRTGLSVQSASANLSSLAQRGLVTRVGTRPSYFGTRRIYVYARTEQAVTRRMMGRSRATGSPWGPVRARQIAEDRPRGWHNRVTLGARIGLERAHRRESARSEGALPIGEYCRWPKGRHGIDGWDC